MPTEQDVRLLSALRSAGSTSALRDLPEHFFVDDDARQAFLFLRSHVQQHRAFPSVATFLRHTGIQTVVTTEPLSYYIERARRGALYTRVMVPYGAMRDAMDGMEPDQVVEAARQILALNTSLSSSASDYITLQAAMVGVVADYEVASQTMMLRGITTGWPEVDDVTDGWQNDDLISVIGRPGVGKTYVLLYMAYHAWLAGYNVLFASMELGAMQLARRMFGLHSRINPNLIRRGQLSTHMRAGIENEMSGFGENGVPFNIIQGGLRKSVSTVEAVADATDPDIIFADASYLMKPASKSKGNSQASRRENVADTIEDLKRITLDRHRPIVQSLQFNRQAEPVRTKTTSAEDRRNSAGNPTGNMSLAKIGETDVVGQASSVVVGFTVPDRMQPQNTRWGRFLKGREGEGGTFQINYNFNPVDLSLIQFGVTEAANDDEEPVGDLNAHMV